MKKATLTLIALATLGNAFAQTVTTTKNTRYGTITVTMPKAAAERLQAEAKTLEAERKARLAVEFEDLQRRNHERAKQAAAEEARRAEQNQRDREQAHRDREAKLEAEFNPDNHSVRELSYLRIVYANAEPGSPAKKLIVALEKREAEQYAAETPLRMETELREVNRNLDKINDNLY